jgi:N-acetyl-alpha-D-muramate 1-phosphate uridylyltransferase
MLPIAVLAGGFATRLGELTKQLPKCLIEIKGRAFVDWQMELLSKNGYTDFVFCVSYKSDLVQRFLGNGSRWNVQIEYSLDGETQLGTGGAIAKALPLLGEQFAVIYGDSYLPINYSQVEHQFMSSNAMAQMTVYENRDQYDASNVEFKDGKLVQYRKGSKEPMFRHIDYGLTYFNKAAFLDLAEHEQKDLADICTQLSDQRKLEGFEVYERFYEVGSIRGIKEFSDYIGMG